MEEKKQGKHIFKIILIILGMLAFGALGFYFGSQDTFHVRERKTKTNTTVTNTVIIEPEVEEESITDNEMIELKTIVEGLPRIIDGISVYISDSNEVKTFSAILDLYSEGVGTENADEDNCIIGIYEESVLEEYYKNHYTGSPKHQTYSFVTYENGIYTEHGCIGFEDPRIILTYIDSYDKDDNYYYVYEYAGLKNIETNVIYKDVTDDAAIYEDGNENTTITVDNKENFTKYTHRFIKNSNGTFLYDSTYIAN